MTVIPGEPRVKVREGRKILEISGAKPEVDAGAVLGVSANGAAMVEAKIFARKAGRSYPRFGIGVHGQTGFRLLLIPARKELQLVRNDQVVKTVPFAWQSETWVRLRLEVTGSGAGKWRVHGKA